MGRIADQGFSQEFGAARPGGCTAVLSGWIEESATPNCRFSIFPNTPDHKSWIMGCTLQMCTSGGSNINHLPSRALSYIENNKGKTASPVGDKQYLLNLSPAGETLPCLSVFYAAWCPGGQIENGIVISINPQWCAAPARLHRVVEWQLIITLKSQQRCRWCRWERNVGRCHCYQEESNTTRCNRAVARGVKLPGIVMCQWAGYAIMPSTFFLSFNNFSIIF